MLTSIGQLSGDWQLIDQATLDRLTDGTEIMVSWSGWGDLVGGYTLRKAQDMCSAFFRDSFVGTLHNIGMDKWHDRVWVKGSQIDG